MTTTRRPSDVSLHDWQHELIEQRLAEWRAAPTGTELDRVRRRELAKRAYWTIRGHLHGVHGISPESPVLGDIEDMHDRCHIEAV